MAAFKDSAGREWDIAINFGNLPRLRDCGFDVAKARGDPGQLDCLNDPEVLGRVVWVFVEKQATARGVTEDALAEAIDGPAIHSILTAIGVALYADFSRTPAVAARIKEKLPGVMARIEAEQVARVEAAMSGPTSTPAATNSPEPSASIPAP